MHGGYEQEVDLFVLARDAVKILQTLLLIMAADKRPYTMQSTYQCLVLEVIFRAEIKKDPWHNASPSDGRKEEVVKNMRDNRALQDCWKQVISDLRSPRKCSSLGRLFKMLSSGTLLSQNVIHGGIMRGRGELS